MRNWYANTSSEGPQWMQWRTVADDLWTCQNFGQSPLRTSSVFFISLFGVWNVTLGLQLEWILKLVYSVVKWCTSCEEQFSWLGAVFSWSQTTHVVPLSGSWFSSIFIKYFCFNPPLGDQSYQFFFKLLINAYWIKAVTVWCNCSKTKINRHT